MIDSATLALRILRANPRYSFQALSDIPQSTKRLIGRNVDHSGFFGILADIDDQERSIKAISSETFSLFAQLKVPAQWSTLSFHGAREGLDDTLIFLVLEGILEIEIDGVFVSGVLAANSLPQFASVPIHASNALGEISYDALRHVQRLDINEPETLAVRLYFYNRLPNSARCLAQLQDVDSVLNYLGTRVGMCRSFSHLPGDYLLYRSDINSGWISWGRRRFDISESSSDAAKYKLYISPVLEDMPRAFEAVVELLASSDAVSLKVGADAIGLLRPDKFVVYFETFDSLSEFARQLEASISGIRAQGVPFSAAIDSQGLLSWGIDPNWAQSEIGMFADNSWRLWVCNRLALATVEAKKVDTHNIEPWKYGLLKAWYYGINTVNWAPRDSQSADY